MLTELYEYACLHNLAASPGFKPKKPKGYVCLSSDGTFLGIQVREKNAEPVYAPDIGSAANGDRYCNPLVEKAKYPLCIIEDEDKDRNVPVKHSFFLSMLESGSTYEPYFHIVAEALQSEETKNAILVDMGRNKLKGADVIGFIVDGMPLEQKTTYLDWWAKFRKTMQKAPEGDLKRCLITGELASALSTVPKVSGLSIVGGHTAGDAFLCFDKDAFQSYELKKSSNAAVSEDAMTAVNASLNELISQAPIFGGAKIVHWYSGDIPGDTDLFSCIFDGIWVDDESEGVSEDTDSDEKERDALRKARQLLNSIRKGERAGSSSSRYYIMPLSGMSGRMMVRGWYEGSFDTLCLHINQWFDDLQLIRPRGVGLTNPPKLAALCTRLLSPGGNPRETWSRMDKELANLSGRLLDSIINGNPLPDEVASRSLRYIRSAMLSGSDESRAGSSIQSESRAFQLLKAWLVRRQRQRGDQNIMGAEINTLPHSVAYCCGQLMAVYAAIQARAMPEVNVTIAERYYAAASSTPAFVIGKLSQLSQHHLSKMEEGLAIYYQRMLDGIYAQIHQPIPTTINQEQQTEFALGYYQQRAAMFAPKDKT